MDVQLPDGSVIQDVPEGTTKAQLIAKLNKNGYDTTDLFNQLSKETSDKISNSAADGMSAGEKAWVGFGSTLPKMWSALGQIRNENIVNGSGVYDPNLYKGTPEFGQMQNQQNQAASDLAESKVQIDQTKADLNKLGGWGTTGQVAGNIGLTAPLMAAPGANSAVGSTIIGGLQGLLEPVGTKDSRAVNTGIGSAAGLFGYGAGYLPGWVTNTASNKVASIESSVAQKAAAQAAADTASARSAAGNAAQNAYRQLEHLRELGAMRALSPEEAQLASSLESELAQKAAEKLVPAAAQKEATAQAYKEALGTESQRAADMYAQKLSGDEVKQQIMARVKRYGPAVLGGLVGNMIFPGIGGAAGGMATGLAIRPTIRSVVTLAKNPALQHAVLSPLAKPGLLSNPALAPSLGLLLPAYASQ